MFGIETLKAELLAVKQQTDSQDKDFKEMIEVLEAELKNLSQRKEMSSDIPNRIADLEVKMAKLWGLLVETTPMGKEKLSKFGRKFGGRSKVYNQ